MFLGCFLLLFEWLAVIGVLQTGMNAFGTSVNIVPVAHENPVSVGELRSCRILVRKATHSCGALVKVMLP